MTTPEAFTPIFFRSASVARPAPSKLAGSPDLTATRWPRISAVVLSECLSMKSTRSRTGADSTEAASRACFGAWPRRTEPETGTPRAASSLAKACPAWMSGFAV